MKEPGEIKIGLLGYGFMGKMHAHGYITVDHQFADTQVRPLLHAVAGIGEEDLSSFAKRFGFRTYTTDWRVLVHDPEIDLVDICLPEHMHKEVCLAAIEQNKHVLCEKPLALNAADAMEIVDVSRDKQLTLMCGFNYRFLPAIQLARVLIREKKIGDIYSIRAAYCQDSGHDPGTPLDNLGYARGEEALGSIRGIGSHLIDIARYLVGDIISLSGTSRTFCPERRTAAGKRKPVDTDEATFLVAEFANGAIGSLSTSVVATGRRNQLSLEINGSRGSLYFDLEHLNWLEVYLDRPGDTRFQGFSRINVTDKNHPFMEGWWPPAHILGWETGHINELHHLLTCTFNGQSVDPLGATFLDGAIAAIIAEHAAEAVKSGNTIRFELPDNSGSHIIRNPDGGIK